MRSLMHRLRPIGPVRIALYIHATYNLAIEPGENIMDRSTDQGGTFQVTRGRQNPRRRLPNGPRDKLDFRLCDRARVHIWLLPRAFS